MTSSISVVIPAYNRAELIGETLRSLLNQTVPAAEIVVVDDGSTDSTAEVVESEFAAFSRQFAANQPSAIGHLPLPRLRLIRQENAGPGAARNRGLAESTGEFIHFFDSDDIAAPNKQEVQLRALQESGADIALGPWIKGRIDEETAGGRRSETGDRRRVARQPTDKRPRDERLEAAVKSGELSVASGAAGDCGVSVNRRFGDSGLKHGSAEQLKHRFDAVGPVLQAKGLPEGDWVKALLTDWSIVPQACLFRRSILERVGGFPEDIWVGEDQLMFLRCLLAGAEVVHTPGTLTYYRAGGEGKLTSVGEAQRRHARDYSRFLVRAHEEVKSGEWRVAGNDRGTEVGCQPERSVDSVRRSRGQRPEVRGLRTESERTSEEPVTRDSLPATQDPKDPSSWFGFRLRAYEAWKDLEKFFPSSEEELKAMLSKVGRFEGSKVAKWKYEIAGWWGRKVGGLKKRLFGYREHLVFRCGRYAPAHFEDLTEAMK